MEYRRCKVNEEYRSSEYLGTVTSKNDKDLLAIKADTRARNKNAREWIRRCFERTGEFPRAVRIERIQLMARGPRSVPSAKDFGGRRRCYDQSLPHRYATHFDVYKRPDTFAEFEMEYQLENNLTPGQHALIKREERKLWFKEIEMFRKLKEKGVQAYGKPGGRTEYKGI